MANLNKVFLMGNLTRDPQLRYTPNQQPVCEFGIAINRKWKAGDGQMKEDVCFVNCTAWAKQAELISKHLTKGQPIFVEGRLTFQSWDGPDGKKRTKLDVTVENFQFIGTPKGGGQGGGGGSGGAGGAARPPAQGPADDAKRQESSGAQNQAAPTDYDFSQDLDDDTIPF
jgi:single-strand DNA-binding protein